MNNHKLSETITLEPEDLDTVDRTRPDREDKSGDGLQRARRDAPKKSLFSKKRFLIGGLVVLLILAGAASYWLHARHFESTDDAYTAADVHEISARVAGTVEHVYVKDNQHVTAGQPLIELDPRDFKVAVEKARAEAVQAKAKIAQRRAATEEAQASLDRTQSDYDRVTGLYRNDVKAVSKADVDNATAALKSARGALDSARADLAAAEAASATAAASLSEAELQLSYTVVTAPVDGTVGKKTIETGGRIMPGQALMAVVERNVWVLGNFKETQLARMRVGQHVEVKIDAVPDHTFSAHVDSFQPGTGAAFALLPPDNATGNFTKIVQRVPVKIVFDHLDGYRNRIEPGLSCTPTVDLRTGPGE